MSNSDLPAAAKPHLCEACSASDRQSGDQPSSHGNAFVYAVGRVEARFPSLAVEKEFAQAAGRAETGDLGNPDVVRSVLSQPHNRYIARHLCYVLTIGGIEAYVLQCPSVLHLQDMIDALGKQLHPADLHVVVGSRGGLAPPTSCNGLVLPLLAFDRIYLFEPDAIPDALPRNAGLDESAFRAAANETVSQVLQLAANAGVGNEQRAVNYLIARYPGLYSRIIDASFLKSSLSAVETRVSRLSGARSIVSVVFSLMSHETTAVQKVFARVDVTEMFPFLVSALAPYYDR